MGEICEICKREKRVDVEKVSVIIPAYNAELTLRRAVDSVTAQDYDNLEVVVVDDGSTDGTLALARALAAADGRLVVVTGENAGSTEARRKGVEASTGSWLMWLDADDRLADRAVSRLLTRALALDVDYLAGSLFTQYRRDGRFYREQRPYPGVTDGEGFLARVLSPVGNLPCWAGISRRELWAPDVFPPSDKRLPCEDRFLNVGLSQRMRRVAVDNDIAVAYYHCTEGITATGALFDGPRWACFFSCLRERLQERGLLEQHEAALRVLEVDALAFHVKRLDPSQQWYRTVVAYDAAAMPRKYRVLKRLVRFPRLWPAIRAVHRWVKRLSGRSR